MDLVLILQVLSISAIITTVSLFFCGIPICFEIWKRKSTKDISGVPIIMGLLGGSFWLRYGFLKVDPTMITVNAVGVTLYSIYSVFYLTMSNPRRMFGVQLILVLSTIFIMVLLVLIYGILALNPLGVCCMTFNIANFGAPLAGLKVVLRRRCCDTLPLPMCIANLLVSSQWFLYGTIVNDIYVMIPNGCGIVLAAIQLALFVVFPMKAGQIAPIGRCLAICAEKPPIDEEKADHSSTHRAHRVGDIIRKISYSCSTTKDAKDRQSAMWEKYTRSLSFDTASTHTTGSEMDMSIDPFNLIRTLSAPQLTEDDR